MSSSERASSAARLSRLPFLWGAALSAHQAEGGNTNNDWWRWEQEGGHIRDGTRSGSAADHYRRYAEDFDLARSLGQNAHRLSLEWSRIEPTCGRFDRAALDHYRDVLGALHERQMYAVVTLHHFTNPLWVAETGGWERRETVRAFGRYVQAVCAHLGQRIDVWITMNEPLIFVGKGYLEGGWPPGVRSLRRAAVVRRNLVSAHREAYRTIHGVVPNALVGIAKGMTAFRAASRRSRDRLAAALSSRVFNDGFVRAVRRELDVLGINYYRSVVQRWCWKPQAGFTCAVPPRGPVSDLGWAIDPEGLRDVLWHASRWGVPLIVTENGIADAAGTRRAAFITDHLAVLARARAEGVPVHGYFYWSLIDTFEWQDGFAPKFGLIAVDRETGARTVRPSAEAYARRIPAAGGPA